jgi:hypothetical protein
MNEQTTSTLNFTRDDRGRLALRKGDDEPVENVRVARCFPWTNRGEYISVRNADGKELHLLRTLDGIDADSRALIDQELTAQEFFPRITAVLSTEQRFDLTLWQVETDRGPTALRVKDSEDIRHLDDKRILVKDRAGGLFEIADFGALDPRRRRFSCRALNRRCSLWRTLAA